MPRLTARLEHRPGPGREGLWAGFTVPEDVVVAVGALKDDGARRGRVPVKGTVNGTPYRSSITRQGDGSYEFIVGRVLRVPLGLQEGDVVDVVMDADLEERRVETPQDLADAVAAHAGLRKVWESLPYSLHREYTLALDDAKTPETRARRIGQIIQHLVDRRRRG